MKFPLVGPSSPLRVSKAETRRSINMIPVNVDSGSGKSQVYAEAIPGLVEEYDLGQECRGFCVSGNRVFATAGDTQYELYEDGSTAIRGALLSVSGPVGMDKNRNEIVTVDGSYGYTMNLSTNTLSQITSAAFYGSQNVSVIAGRAVYVKPGTDIFYVSAIDAAGTLDILEFATAESSPDILTGVQVDHGQLYLMGQEGGEVWDTPTTAGPDFPLVRNNGARIQVGCAGFFTLKQLDNTLYWLGQDKNGAGTVYKFSGFQPVPVSNYALSQALLRAAKEGNDLSQSTAFSEQYEGRGFYHLNVPGLDTTWVYDTSTGLWHERAEIVAGSFTQHRANSHFYAFGKHFVGSASGKIYRLDSEVNTNAGDPLYRRLIGPHLSGKDGEQTELTKIGIDCDVGGGRPDGTAPLVMFRYSKNGGKTWSSWHYPNLGVVGDGRARPAIYRPGIGRDWVVDVGCTEDTRFNVIGGIAA